MKHSKLFLAGLLAIGMASSANAYVIHITGSTAVGAALNQAILEYLGAPSGTQTLTSPAAYGYDSGSPIGTSKNAIFTDGAGNYIVTAMTGSEAGVQAVAFSSVGASGPTTQPTVSFFDESVVSGLTQAGTSGLATAKHAVVADVCMSDTLQATSRFAPVSSGGTYGNYATLVEPSTVTGNTGLGVIEFTYLVSNGGKYVGTGANAGHSMTGTITNITSAQAQSLFKVGETLKKGLTADQFTGNSADAAYKVFPIGRNIDSGTRLSFAVDAGLPANTTLVQFLPTDSTGTGATTTVTNGNSAQPVGEITSTSQTAAKLFVWPVETINSVSSGSTGNGGYSSGGSLSTAIGRDWTGITVGSGVTSGASGLVLLGYAGVADAANALAAKGGVGAWISFNGVPYSDAAIELGQYSFWGYEHLYYVSGYANSTVADGIAAKLAIQSTNGFLPLSLMGTTTRTSDGALITH